MAKQLQNLVAAASLNDSDIAHVKQGAQDKKATISQINDKIGTAFDRAAAITTAEDADLLAISDESDSFSLKKISIANFKTFIKDYIASVAMTFTNKTITGGSVSGITDLAVADGGTGASSASAARTNLGLAIGTDVQAQDAELQAIAGLTSAADRVPYFTGLGTAALATLTSAGRSLIAAADAAAQRVVLGLGSIATQDSDNVSITGGSVLGITAILNLSQAVNPPSISPGGTLQQTISWPGVLSTDRLILTIPSAWSVGGIPITIYATLTDDFVELFIGNCDPSASVNLANATVKFTALRF